MSRSSRSKLIEIGLEANNSLSSVQHPEILNSFFGSAVAQVRLRIYCTARLKYKITPDQRRHLWEDSSIKTVRMSGVPKKRRGQRPQVDEGEMEDIRLANDMDDPTAPQSEFGDNFSDDEVVDYANSGGVFRDEDFDEEEGETLDEWLRQPRQYNQRNSNLRTNSILCVVFLAFVFLIVMVFNEKEEIDQLMNELETTLPTKAPITPPKVAPTTPPTTQTTTAPTETNSTDVLKYKSKKVEVSSTFAPRRGAQFLIDGDKKTWWSSKSFSEDKSREWIAFWLEDGIQTIDCVELWPRPGAPVQGFPSKYDFRFHNVSSGLWQMIMPSTDQPEPNTPIVLVFPEAVETSGIRIDNLNPDPDAWFQLAEVTACYTG